MVPRSICPVLQPSVRHPQSSLRVVPLSHMGSEQACHVCAIHRSDPAIRVPFSTQGSSARDIVYVGSIGKFVLSHVSVGVSVLNSLRYLSGRHESTQVNSLSEHALVLHLLEFHNHLVLHRRRYLSYARRPSVVRLLPIVSLHAFVIVAKSSRSRSATLRILLNLYTLYKALPYMMAA